MIKQLPLKVNQNIKILNLINTNKKYGTFVKEYGFIKPNIDSVSCVLNVTNKDCRKEYFHSFENRCVYHIKFTTFRNNEEVILSITLEYIKFKCQLYGLSNKRNNGSIFNEIVKLTKTFIVVYHL